ncbi:She9 / Mdm33-like protein [Elsinoe fawcettii]|nr:She9 / Mdm33-like protein [Elsinoe fawcettii]
MSVPRHGAKIFFQAVDTSLISPLRASVTARPGASSICQRCGASRTLYGQSVIASGTIPIWRKAFATSARRSEKTDRDGLNPRPGPSSTPSTASQVPSSDRNEPAYHDRDALQPKAAPTTDHEKLPSHLQSLRSDYSKRFQVFMDELLAKAAVAGQRLNTYTGTDYTGIEQIRRQITELESRVKTLHDSVAAAKDAYTTAHSAQISSQREVVSLLERKASWTPHDLDRYTSLIRSEHLHEQGVTQAKQKLSEAERELEEARTDLEKKERRQYHEEQVWSDTIRRNSTWVTFGLMGLNILLLVTNIGIVEPWRRRRLVREVKDALDQKTLVSQVGENTSRVAPIAQVENDTVVPVAAPSEIRDDVEPQVERAAEPQRLPIDAPEQPVTASHEAEAKVEVKPAEVAVIVEPAPSGADQAQDRPVDWQAQLSSTARVLWGRTKEVYLLWSKGPLSHEVLILKNIEITSIALEGAAVGMTVASIIMWLVRTG